MKAEDLKKIEKDSRFKKKYVSIAFWLKNAAIYPPSLFLFFSLFGLLYLLNYDLLITYYAIPFVLLFLLATIWFKSSRRYILHRLFEKEGTYLVCLAKIVKEQDDKVSLLITTGDKRHNKYYMQNIEQNIENLGFSDCLKEIDTANLPESFHVKSFKKADVLKLKYSCNVDDIVPLLYINNNNIVLIKRKDAGYV